MLLWQGLFFVIPLAFLVYLSFWLVRNYRMVPGFDAVNWVGMYGKDYFWDAYGLTLGLATLSTVVTTFVAFPCAYALAFKVSDTVRRWAIFFLIIPFFTSYLVRIYAWQVIIAEHGVINAVLAHLGRAGGPADQCDRHLRVHHLHDPGLHRPGAASEVFESGFLRGGTRLRRVGRRPGGSRQEQATRMPCRSEAQPR